jgi:hypothetical protein
MTRVPSGAKAAIPEVHIDEFGIGMFNADFQYKERVTETRCSAFKKLARQSKFLTPHNSP